MRVVLCNCPPADAERIARALLEIAAQDLHQGRLAAAVGADQTITVAVGELDRDHNSSNKERGD